MPPIVIDNTERPRPVRGKQPSRSDASCFVSFADKRPGGDLPSCYRCGKSSIGANFRELFSGYPSGKPSGIVEFSCGCDGRGQYAIRAETCGVSWKFISEIEAGVWRVVKRNRIEKLELTKAE